MIRILHSVSNMDRAGIETMLMNYYRHIDRSKIQFDFLCNKKKPGAYDAEIKEMGGNIYHTPGLNAAASNNDNFLRKSASGGAFAVLAENVLKKDGVVYGAALPLENGKLEPKHLRIDTVERLPELQGSKYVQSAIGDTYAQAQKDLLDGKRVLFSGTPCQIAGLKQYLKKDYEMSQSHLLQLHYIITFVRQQMKLR